MGVSLNFNESSYNLSHCFLLAVYLITLEHKHLAWHIWNLQRFVKLYFLAIRLAFYLQILLKESYLMPIRVCKNIIVHIIFANEHFKVKNLSRSNLFFSEVSLPLFISPAQSIVASTSTVFSFIFTLAYYILIHTISSIFFLYLDNRLFACPATSRLYVFFLYFHCDCNGLNIT